MEWTPVLESYVVIKRYYNLAGFTRFHYNCKYASEREGVGGVGGRGVEIRIEIKLCYPVRLWCLTGYFIV